MTVNGAPPEALEARDWDGTLAAEVR
ncbi:MAG: hypothetical protein JWP43_2304, partial [Ramlibacter sp.]|nr:hypothetical protein [Ramlibacter sp.]